MEPIQIVLIVLVAAGIWAVVELALTIRRARTTVDTLDKTMNEVNARFVPGGAFAQAGERRYRSAVCGLD